MSLDNKSTSAIDGAYNSAGTTANRDGNLLARTEFIIDSLLSTPPVRVTQSDSTSISEGTYGYFNVQIYDVNGDPYTAADIDITAGTAVLDKSTAGGAFSSVGITQPTLLKGLGHIDVSVLFKADEWAPDDLYRLTLSGVTVQNGEVHTLQTFVWNNFVTIVNDIDAEVDSILEMLTVPAIDNVDNASITDVLGMKGDTPKTDLTATVMNNLKALFASSMSKRIRISEVINTTSFKTTDIPALGTGGLIGWYVYCSLDAGGVGGAPQGEYRIISNWVTGVSGTFTHEAFSAPLTTSDKVIIVHASIYNMIVMMPEIAKIASIKTTVEAITGYALDATVAKAATVALVKTETDKIPAEVIKTAYIQAQTQRTCPKKTTASLSTQNLFTIAGGAVEIIRIIGHITTATQASNNNTKLVFTSTGGAAVDLCGTNNMNNKVVRKVISITKVKSDAMLVSADDWVVVITAVNQLVLVPGVISLNCAGNTSGVIDWEIQYTPITDTSTIVPA